MSRLGTPGLVRTNVGAGEGAAVNSSPGTQSLFRAVQAIGVGIAQQDAQRTQIHELNTARASLIEGTDQIRARNDLSPTEKMTQIGELNETVSSGFTSFRAQSQFNVDSARHMGRVNAALRDEVDQLKIGDAEQDIKFITEDSDMDAFNGRINALGLPDATTQKILSAGLSRRNTLRRNALAGIATEITTDFQMVAVNTELDTLTEDVGEVEALRQVYLTAANAVSQNRDPDSLKKVKRLLKPLGKLFPVEKAAILSRAERNSIGASGAQKIDGIVTGRESGKVPQSQKAHESYINGLMDSGMPISEVSKIYSLPAMSEVGIPVSLVNAIKNAAPSEANLALINLIPRDGTGDDAELIAKSIDKETLALFNGTRGMSTTSEQFQKEMAVADSPDYGDGVGRGVNKIRGLTGAGTKSKPEIAILTRDESANAMGIPPERMSAELTRRFQQVFLHEMGLASRDPKSGSGEKDQNAFAILKAGRRMQDLGYVPSFVGDIAVDRSLVFSDPDITNKLRANAEAASVSAKIGDIPESLDEVPFFSVVRQELAGGLGDLFSERKVRVDNPFIKDSKIHIPITQGDKVTGLMQFNPDGPSRLISANSDEFRSALESQDKLVSNIFNSDESELRFQPDYGSRFIDEVEGPQQAVIGRGIRKLIQAEYLRSHGRASPRRGDSEGAVSDKQDAAIIMQRVFDRLGGWKGFSRPKNEE